MRPIRNLVLLIAAVAAAIVAFFQFAPETATRIALAAERQRSGLTRKAIDLPDGLHYVYLEGGAGEPVVLLHGFGADKDNFTRVARYLTPRYRVIVPDHVGFGESSHLPEADYTARAQAARVHEFVGKLGLGRVHLGGSSMGGHIALAYAAEWPDEVASLWLLDPGGVWSGPPSELETLIRTTGRNPLTARTEDEFSEVYAFAMSQPPYVPRAVLDVMARERIRNHALEEKIFAQIRSDPDRLEDRIRGLATPSLVVWGREDRAIHVGTADVLHGLLPNSEVIVMDGIGHLPMIEAPDRSAADYLAFLASLGDPPGR